MAKPFDFPCTVDDLLRVTSEEPILVAQVPDWVWQTLLHTLLLSAVTTGYPFYGAPRVVLYPYGPAVLIEGCEAEGDEETWLDSFGCLHLTVARSFAGIWKGASRQTPLWWRRLTQQTPHWLTAGEELGRQHHFLLEREQWIVVRTDDPRLQHERVLRQLVLP